MDFFAHGPQVDCRFPKRSRNRHAQLYQSISRSALPTYILIIFYRVILSSLASGRSKKPDNTETQKKRLIRTRRSQHNQLSLREKERERENRKQKTENGWGNSVSHTENPQGIAIEFPASKRGKRQNHRGDDRARRREPKLTVRMARIRENKRV